MKKLLMLLFFISGTIFAQETEFKITNEGYTRYVVEEIAEKKQNEIYDKVLNWALVTYKNPDRSITVKKENEYIRINSAYAGNTYIIEVAVKDEKYKFSLITFEGHSGSISVSLMDVRNMLNKEGKVKWIYGGHQNFIDHFNTLNKGLKDFILNNVEISKQDW
jgi:hypothetical protein